MEERYLHNPVLLKEALHFLEPAPGKIIIDATIGGAGHAEEILQKILPLGILVGIDRDSESLKIARDRLKKFNSSFKLINENFKNLKEITKDLGEVDGILFDLGISSIQMDERERGFSIRNVGPLDMRMDRAQQFTAKDLVNNLAEVELSQIIRDFGEDRFHRRIARAIVYARKKRMIETTKELADIVFSSLPRNKKRERIHPATRTFQAIRIKLNDELGSLEKALRESPGILKRGGRICVISFHSLEDRIVKRTFKDFSSNGIFDLLTKKPVMAEERETLGNPRSRSAKLRAAVKR